MRQIKEWHKSWVNYFDVPHNFAPSNFVPGPNSNFLFGKLEITGLFPEFPGGPMAPGVHATEFFLMTNSKWGWPLQLCFYKPVPQFDFQILTPQPLGRTPGAPGVRPMTRHIVPELTHGPNEWGSLI